MDQRWQRARRHLMRLSLTNCRRSVTGNPAAKRFAVKQQPASLREERTIVGAIGQGEMEMPDD